MGRLLLVAPLLMLAFSAWVFRETQNEVHMRMDRAKSAWRLGDYKAAIRLYEDIVKAAPRSRYAPEALWELASIQYVDLRSPKGAIEVLRRLSSSYPNHPLARDSLFRLADILDKDFAAPQEAIAIWEVLQGDPALPETRRHRALYRLGNAYFQINEFQTALGYLQPLLEKTVDEELSQQARVLAGAIAQIEGDYARSVPLFRAVLKSDACDDCHLQARLALIQSYEFLHDLPSAIEVAKGISSSDFTPAAKQELVQRLIEKQRFDRP